MENKLNQLMLMVALLVTLPSCNSIGISNPFGLGSQEQSRTPQNATAYLCDGNKQFYVRMQNNGNDAWLIYPNHEVNLTKASDSNNRFTSGVISLVINGDETTLNDGEKIAYVACKPQPKK
jgi:membrane-bound inhibitor of C-type lysozyme